MRNLAIAASVTIVLVALLLSGKKDTPLPEPRPVAALSSPAPDGLQEPPATEDRGLVGYAVALNELHGLPPDAAPGTPLELWVAWEPPVTKRPRIQLLIADAVLEAVVPPVSPEGPFVAKLLVPQGKISDLFYGDRYGSLSVAVPDAATSLRG